MNLIKPIKIDFTLFEPDITEKQTKVHYNGHYLKYIKNLNKALEEDEPLKKVYSNLEQTTDNKTLKNSLLLTIAELYDSNSDIVHNASQIYNHEFYWKSLISTNESLILFNNFKYKLFKSDDEITSFYNNFINLGTKHFGSGWLWIILKDNKIDVITTHDAIIPYKNKLLGVIDLWEHAYYLDYESERKKYLENMYKMLNWGRIFKKI
jgi:Fe-Mn family superoxide dismutase